MPGRGTREWEAEFYGYSMVDVSGVWDNARRSGQREATLHEQGVHENECFSINIPSTKTVEKTDYCGTYSGNQIDKSAVFEVFYGELKDAPMIKECPVTMECKLVKTVDFEHNEMLVGKVVGVYVEESCRTGDHTDVMKVDPLLYEGGPPATYWNIGKQIAKAYDVGKGFSP